MKGRGYLPEVLGVALLFMAARAVRVYFLHYRSVMAPDYDGAEYLTLGKTCLLGKSCYTTFIPPGFPMLLAAALPFFRQAQTAGMTVSALCGAALLVPVYLLTKEVFGRKAAYVAAALTAVSGSLVVISTWVMSEMPYAFLLYTGLYLGLVFIKRRDFLSGLGFAAAFGAGYLVRPESFVFFVAAAPLVFGRACMTTDAGCRKRTALCGAASLLLFAALCLPYIVCLRRDCGMWTISWKLFYNLAPKGRIGPGADTLAYVGGHVSALWEKYLANLPTLWEVLRESCTLPGLVFVALGVPLALRGVKGPKCGVVLLALPTLYPFMLPLFMVDIRVMAPYNPALLIWGAAGAVRLEEMLAKLPRAGKAARYSALTAALALFFAGNQLMGVYNFFNSNEYRVSRAYNVQRYVVTGEWIKSRSAPGDKVLSRELLPVFYSGREYLNLPDYEPERLYRYAKENGVRWLIVDDVCTAKRKNLGPLLGPGMGMETLTPGFMPVYFNSAAGVVVYMVADGV